MASMIHSTPARPLVKRQLLTDFPILSPVHHESKQPQRQPEKSSKLEQSTFHRPWLEGGASNTSITADIHFNADTSLLPPVDSTPHVNSAMETPHVSRVAPSMQSRLTPMARSLAVASTPVKGLHRGTMLKVNTRELPTIPPCSVAGSMHIISPNSSGCSSTPSSADRSLSPESMTHSVSSREQYEDITPPQSTNSSPTSAPGYSASQLSQLSVRISQLNSKLFAYLCTLPNGPAKVRIQQLYYQYEVQSVAIETQRFRTLTSQQFPPLTVKLSFDAAHNRLLDVTERMLEATVSSAMLPTTTKNITENRAKAIDLSIRNAQPPAAIECAKPTVAVQPRCNATTPSQTCTISSKLKGVDSCKQRRVTDVRHRPLLPVTAVKIMSDWFYSHLDNPYPSKEEAKDMAARGNISLTHLRRWFINKRAREWRQHSNFNNQL